MAHFLDRILGDPSQKKLKRLRLVVDQIGALEPELEKLSDKQLKERSLDLKSRIQKDLGYQDELPEISKDIHKKEQTVLDKHAPEAFALVREAAKRTLGQRHFDEQLLAGLVLHEGGIAEQRTGEGKTLSATLPSYLNALVGRGSHVVTVNDYLAKRDAGWMGQVHNALGLTVACLNHDSSFIFSTETVEEGQPTENLRPCSRQEAYAADITYGTNAEFGFDYLRDNMAPAPIHLRQRPLYFCLIDEVDSILIDEARTPLIISAPAEESTDLYSQFAQIVRRLGTDDYTLDEKERAVRISDTGIHKMQQALHIDNLYDNEHIQLVHHLEEAMKAEFLFQKDKDYVVREGEIVIVDEFTGRLMPGRRYSEGLHQAIEAKEGVHVQRESDTLATISLQNYFRLYLKRAGMTGTAKTEEEEFIKMYGMEVVVIPTHREMIRRDQTDKVYVSEEAKFKAIIEDVRERQAKGQPVLIGTISVAKNEQLGQFLEKAGIQHEILNAKNHEREAGIIANAGKPGSVTLATNMAGRGTDIMMGGSPPEKNDSEAFAKWEADRQIALEAGGLTVIGSERHESRRIDNQLRGRSGRQGEPGESVFYVSLDDDLMRIFGGDWLKGFMQKTKVPEDIPIQNSLVSRSIEQAQKRVEGNNFDIRKHVVQYDDVMNRHRDTVYKLRSRIMRACGPDGSDATSLEASTLKDEVMTMIDRLAKKIVGRYFVGEKFDWQIDEAVAEVKQIAPLSNNATSQLETILKDATDTKQAVELIKNGLVGRYGDKEKAHTPNEQRLLERLVMLRTIDALWVEHLNVMNDLRQGIGLQSVAQQDPLIVYQQRGYERFQHLLAAIDVEVVRQLMHLVKAESPNLPPALNTEQAELTGGDEATAETALSPETNSITEVKRAVAAADQAVNVTVRRVADKLQSAGTESTTTSSAAKVGRNDPCPCGSNRKYKHCHGQV
jgi:preprotein translocase subunit SecA